MLGLGSNKAKLLASAEKNVKQGKLQNAIADYEKIISEDPRDLNVLNTIGDLYARMGKPEQAASYFRRVGDAYASEGFTVKAIAIYKKLIKLAPASPDLILKMGELFAQQGLNNDARVQYTAAAEQFMRGGNIQSASGIFQKILELDPDNATMQTRLAELYVRLGRKAEARDIFFRSAQTLRSRGALDACDDVLGQVLRLDPEFWQALALRGQVRLERNDPHGAVQCLEKLRDIDSRPDALRALLQARMKLGQKTEAEPLARKLVDSSKDAGGVMLYAETLMAAGNFEAALDFCQENAATLIPANAAALVDALQKMIAPLKTNSRALQTLCDLFQKAGNTSYLGEVIELLAHASVQEGALPKARDLYKKLAEMEPDNPLHLQNYKQITARLAGNTTARQAATDEGAPTFMVEELEQAIPRVEQKYPAAISAAINEAMTDAELYASYNLPARAIPPLEAVLPRAPQDVQVNQRLASLYARAGRLAEAAQRCEVLKSVHAEAGFMDEARQYGELAAKYAAHGGQPAGIRQPGLGPAAPAVASAPAPEPGRAGTAGRSVPATPVGLAPTSPSPPTPSAHPDAAAHEIDLSAEWERVLSSEPAAAPASARTGSVVAWKAPESAPAAPVTDAALGDIIEEARFYLSQSMVDEAQGALARAETISPGAPAVIELRAQLAALSRARPQSGGQVESFGPASAVAKENRSEMTGLDLGLASPLTAWPAPAGRPAGETSEHLVLEPVLPPPTPQPARPGAGPSAEAKRTGAPAGGGAATQAKPADVLRDLSLDLELSLGTDFTVRPSAETATKPKAASPAKKPGAAFRPEATVASAPDISKFAGNTGEAGAALAGLFAEFKHDLESSIAESDDPETHYSLGVAFKEMGLLDEAIGELQKVCQAIENGQAFAKAIEAYTWLADCFVQTSVPEAGIHWYEKALQLPGLDDEGALAIHYELACACEAAGDVAAARRHFMRVLSLNIDYRDVAERIKALKS